MCCTLLRCWLSLALLWLLLTWLTIYLTTGTALGISLPSGDYYVVTLTDAGRIYLRLG